jgi:hypothetical protein
LCSVLIIFNFSFSIQLGDQVCNSRYCKVKRMSLLYGTKIFEVWLGVCSISLFLELNLLESSFLNCIKKKRMNAAGSAVKITKAHDHWRIDKWNTDVSLFMKTWFTNFC